MDDNRQPEITTLHVDHTQEVEPDVVTAPGAFPTKVAPTIPEWYTVGWRQACGIDKPPLPEGEEKDNSILHMFIAEQFYGAWYHNASIIVFVCLYYSFLCSTSINIVMTGRPGNSLLNAFPLWMGMVIHCSRCMQCHLHNFNVPFP